MSIFLVDLKTNGIPREVFMEVSNFKFHGYLFSGSGIDIFELHACKKAGCSIDTRGSLQINIFKAVTFAPKDILGAL